MKEIKEKVFRFLSIMSILFSICVLSGYFLYNINKYDYKSYDPFRDNLFQLRDNPPKPLESNEHPIPKIIHQFWIGPSSLPDPYKFAVNSCKNMDGFEHKMWGNAEIETLLADREEYQKTFAKIPSNHWSVKKDYLSYLALKKYGGVTVDTSFYCHASLKDIHEKYSYYFYYKYHDDFSPQRTLFSNFVQAGIVAATKDGEVINNIINKFSDYIENHKKYNDKYLTPYMPTSPSEWKIGMAQVILNESIDEYCFKNKEICRDVYILSIDDIYYAARPDNKKSLKFIDLDFVQLQYVVKAFYTGAKDLDNILNIGFPLTE